MIRSKKILLAGVAVAAVAAVAMLQKGKPSKPVAEPKPALTVAVAQMEKAVWPNRFAATGPVLAWQEAIVGAEVGGLRLAEVQANVGDKVKKGALLAHFADEMVQSELRQQQAAYDEAKSRFAEAEMNAKRARQVQDSGALSAQELQQFETHTQTAEAQMKAAEARLEAEKLKLRYTRVTAPDDGVISSRTATVGAVMQAGAEMFRLIRQGRLEWRAELPEYAMQQVQVGQKVRVDVSKTEVVTGKVVRIAPALDAQTRNGMVYVELPEAKTLRAGMFVQGNFDLGQSEAHTLPQEAIVVRDGFAYVYRVGKDGRVEQIKVSTGRSAGGRIEIVSGLQPDARVVATGAGFLNDGDLVRVETAQAASAPAAASQPASAASASQPAAQH